MYPHLLQPHCEEYVSLYCIFIRFSLYVAMYVRYKDLYIPTASSPIVGNMSAYTVYLLGSLSMLQYVS